MLQNFLQAIEMTGKIASKLTRHIIVSECDMRLIPIIFNYSETGLALVKTARR